MAARTTWPALINALLDGQTLTAEEGRWAMSRIMAGEATDAQMAGFAIALRAKGETVGEIEIGHGERLTRARAGGQFPL